MAAPTQFFKPPFDPTQYVGITSPQLLEYLTGATPAVNVGMFVVTYDDNVGNPDVPNGITNIAYQGCAWTRIGVTQASCYIWNPNVATDATLLKWISINTIGIGVGSITGSMIAQNTIQSDNIISVDYNIINGAPIALPPNGAASGALKGNYPNPSLQQGTTALQLLRTNAGVTGTEWVSSSPIAFDTNVSLASAYTYPRVKSDLSGFEMVSSQTFASNLVALGAGSLLLNPAHGLTVTPTVVRAVLVCQTGELGYAAGDEVSADAFVYENSIGGQEEWSPAFQSGANATNVFVTQSSATGLYGAGMLIKAVHKTTGAVTSITAGSWKVKVYART